MAPSGRKAKARAARRAPAVDTNEMSDNDAPEAIATPSRGSKKRARGSEAPAPPARSIRRKTKDSRAMDNDDGDATEAQDRSDVETEPSSPSEQEIIASLKVASKQVNAVSDFANARLEGQDNIPGYGKIAGRDWVYIIRTLEVNIGRPEAHERLTAHVNGGDVANPLPDLVADDHSRGVNGQAGISNGQPLAANAQGLVANPSTIEDDPDLPRNLPRARTVIHIDLGPDRQVSRWHVSIFYERETTSWILLVNGRNGCRIDNNLHNRGERVKLRNGSVIEICNTQMAFITTTATASEGPVWDASIISQARGSSQDEDGDDPSTGNGFAPPHPAARGQLSATGMYQSDYNAQDQQHQQQHQNQQRTHLHSQRTATTSVPGTPIRGQSSFGKSSPAVNYRRGVVMESTDNIDYSLEINKDLKPPHSYAQLIGMAILSCEEQAMTLANIYLYIMEHYSFYRFAPSGWQNSIRHNLSLNKAFSKVARRTDEPGKGMKWIIEPSEYDNFIQQGMKGARRPNPVPGTQSTLGSPTSPRRPKGGRGKSKSMTPPISSYPPAYPSATEAYTPERGPQRTPGGGNVGLGINPDQMEYDLPTRSTPRNNLTAAANAAGSPPTLYVNEEHRMGAMDTPFPQLRPSQRLAPPSSLRRPSDYIQFSSPAPFWRLTGLVGSTPVKPLDFSPLKTPFPHTEDPTEARDDDEEEDEPDEAVEDKDDNDAETANEEEPQLKRRASPILSSSSPSRPHSTIVLEVSPTVSRPPTAGPTNLTALASASEQHAERAAVRHGGLQSEAVAMPAPPTSSSSSSQPSAGPPQAIQQQPQVHTPHLQSGFEASRYGFTAVNQPAYNTHGLSGGYATASSGGGAVAAAPQVNGYHHHHHDDGEDEGIDLAKGFQTIGAFHQRNHLAMSMGLAGAQQYGR